MPQIMIDTSVETPEILGLTAKFLQILAEHQLGLEPNWSNELRDGKAPPPPAAGAPVPGLVPTPEPTPPPPPPPPAEELPLAASAGAPPPPPPQPLPDNVINLTGVTRDKDGLPWDARIHSTPAKLNADGSYRRKRGVDDATFNQVANQLRVPAGTAPAPQVPLPPGNSSVPLPPPPPPVTNTSGVSASGNAGGVPTPGLPAAGAVPPPPPNVVSLPAAAPQAPPSQPGPVPPNQAQVKFRELAQKISSALQAGKLTNEQVIAACKANGVSGLPELLQNPDTIPAVSLVIDSYIAP